MIATKEYTEIIRFRLQNPLPENADGELHHIVPKSCGGNGLQDNLIKLTVDEHVRCHKLLPEIYTTGKEHRAMCYAWRFIAITRNGVLSEEEIAEARKIGVESRRGLPSGMKGKHHKPETLQKMSEAHKGKTCGPLSEEHRKKLSAAHKGKRPWNYGRTGIYSEETRYRMGESGRKRKGIPTGIEPWNKGKHLSEEDKKKKSEAAKRRRKRQNDDN